MPISRGEVYFVKLGPTVGHELDDKDRPVVVVSINVFNMKPLVVAVVPGKTPKPGQVIYSNEVEIQPSLTNGLKNPTRFQCLQIKALDHQRFGRRAGIISPTELGEIEKSLMLCLGLS